MSSPSRWATRHYAHQVTPAEPAIRAPQLQVGRTGAVSRLELFFDLAYVLVIIELVSAFTKDVSWHGLFVLVGLFATIWFSWVGFTLYGNRFDNDDVLFRLGQLAGTLSIAGCADRNSATALAFALCRSMRRGKVFSPRIVR